MKQDLHSADRSPNTPGLHARVSAGKVPQRIKSTGTTGPGAQPEFDFTPAFVWRVFCQWWIWTVPPGLVLAAAAGATIWYLHVPKFEASALVKIEAEAPFIAFQQGVANRDTERYVQTQIELLRGPVVLGPVLSRPEVAATREIKQQFDPLSFVKQQLSVRQVGSSELYQVSFISRSAEDAATVANTVVAEYLVMQDREDRQRSQIVIDVLNKESLERSVKVDQLRNEVVELSKGLTGRDPFGQGIVTDVSALTSATSIRSNLIETEADMEMREAELKALRNAPIVAADKAAAAGLIELEISMHPDVRQLETRISQIKEGQLDVKAKPRPRIGDSWEKDPEYHRLQEQLRLVTAELQQVKAAAAKAWLSLRLEERKAEQQRAIAAKEAEIELLRQKHELFATKFSEQLDQLKATGAQSVELEFAKAELEREQNVFELIEARKLALQTELRAPARVSLMQSARVPTVALVPVPYKLLLLACLGAMVIPFGLALAHETVVRRVSSPEQLSKESLLPVLGEVTRFPLRRVAAMPQALPAAEQRQLMIYTESIESLRTNLMLTENLGIPGQAKVIAICSAASGEGKTSVATSLGMSIAEATNQPTLVLDADLRAPDIGKFFEVPNQPGVSEVLCNKAEIDQAIHRVGGTQTYVLPAGKQRVNPHHILQGSKINELLETLRGKFSTIIIDTPPVLAASESLVYAQAADLVVFCSLADVSRAKQVRAAVDRLQSTGANIAGAVLSGVQFNRYVYRYGAYTTGA
jgi:capsular exopolysaccharide synthesis family protein